MKVHHQVLPALGLSGRVHHLQVSTGAVSLELMVISMFIIIIIILLTMTLIYESMASLTIDIDSRWWPWWPGTSGPVASNFLTHSKSVITTFQGHLIWATHWQNSSQTCDQRRQSAPVQSFQQLHQFVGQVSGHEGFNLGRGKFGRTGVHKVRSFSGEKQNRKILAFLSQTIQYWP